MGLVNGENWNVCHYKSLNLKGFITLSALEDPLHGIRLLYSVTITEDDRRDVFQKDFSRLDDACHFLNRHYAHWEFVNIQDQGLGGGCATCQAKGA